MINVNLDYSFLSNGDITSNKIQKKLMQAHELLRGTNKLDFTGFVDLPDKITKNDIIAIKRTAKQIQEQANLLIVVGIGGSYLGSYSAINMLAKANPKCDVVYVGTNFSATSLVQTLELAKTKEVCINVISKSGSTTENLVAFELLQSYMQKRYKKKNEYKKRIFVTTDAKAGYLHNLAQQQGYTSFVIPTDVGGRYSVLSPVGLLPMAVAGINIDNVIAGAKQAYEYCYKLDELNNPAYKYAIARNLLYTKQNKLVELFCSFNEKFVTFNEWLKQLFAESEGKDKKGMFVSSAIYSTDLHSLGQYVQQGTPLLFETIISTKQTDNDFKLNVDQNSKISYLNGKLISEINNACEQGTIKSHNSAKVPIVKIEIEKLDEKTYGELVYFFEIACAISGLMIGVNPFNQPGVEGYKKNMRELL